MRSNKGFKSNKLRDLHFDVLIALVERTHGAKFIASNRSDLVLIRECWELKQGIWKR
jgi:hypothetical protein